MKMTRNQLKMIVKECLLEILSEGLGQLPQQSTGISGMAENRSVRPRKPNYDPALDRPVSTGRLPTASLREAIQRESGGNPIMASIFADTAMKTLPEMLSHGEGGAPALSQQEQFNGTPEQVFGEDAASRWASLAFMETPTKNSA